MVAERARHAQRPRTERHVDERADDGELPRNLGPYRLVARLGRGGMGDVYLAQPLPPYPSQSLKLLGEQQRLVVVKTVRADLSRDSSLIGRFLDEARTTLLLRHKNIARVLDAGIYDRQVALVMEHVAGFSLADVFRRLAQRDERMPRRVALYVAGELLEALDYAHRLRHPHSDEPLGIVHRDVSPHNVLVGDDGSVKLIDFGVASSRIQTRETQPGCAVGKLLYMSPEQAAGSAVDARSDVYSSAVLISEMLGGYRFYDGWSLDQAMEWLARGVPVHGQKPAGFDMLDDTDRAPLTSALAWRADARVASAALLRRSLLDASPDKPAASAHLRSFLATIFPGEAEKRRAKWDALSPSTLRDDDSDGAARDMHAQQQQARRARKSEQETREVRDVRDVREAKRAAAAAGDAHIASTELFERPVDSELEGDDDGDIDVDARGLPAHQPDPTNSTLGSSVRRVFENAGGETRQNHDEISLVKCVVDATALPLEKPAPVSLKSLKPARPAAPSMPSIVIDVEVLQDDGADNDDDGADPTEVDSGTRQASGNRSVDVVAVPTYLDIERWPTWPGATPQGERRLAPPPSSPALKKRPPPSPSSPSHPSNAKRAKPSPSSPSNPSKRAALQQEPRAPTSSSHKRRGPHPTSDRIALPCPKPLTSAALERASALVDESVPVGAPVAGADDALARNASSSWVRTSAVTPPATSGWRLAAAAAVVGVVMSLAAAAGATIALDGHAWSVAETGGFAEGSATRTPGVTGKLENAPPAPRATTTSTAAPAAAPAAAPVVASAQEESAPRFVTTTTKAPIPARPARPLAQVAHLEKFCAATACASELIANRALVEDLPVAEMRAYFRDVDACLDACGSP